MCMRIDKHKFVQGRLVWGRALLPSRSSDSSTDLDFLTKKSLRLLHHDFLATVCFATSTSPRPAHPPKIPPAPACRLRVMPRQSFHSTPSRAVSGEPG